MKTLQLSPVGLYTNPNTLSETPKGALSVADNIICDRPGILSSRRGLGQYADALVAATKLFNFGDDLLVLDNNLLKYDNAGTWSAGQALSYPLANYRPKSVQSNENFYITSSIGVQKLTSPSATLSLAGIPKALDIAASVTGSGWLQTGNSTIYRVLFYLVDANDNLLLGAPSAPVTIANAGAAANVQLIFTLPTGLTTSHRYRLYRAFQEVTPLDELYLAYDAPITSGDISTGTITVTDVTAEAQLSTNLYTNETQEGILAANNPPPYALDVATYADCVFYANTRQRQSSLIKLIANPAVNDTITINSVVYTAKATETIASGQFDQSGSIDLTCRSLVRVINRYASNTAIYAYYLGEGQIQLERRDFTATTFTTSVSVAASWNIQATSRNEALKNRLYVSKPGEPEAVPFLNFFDVGQAIDDIVRIIPVKDALYICKTDGVFRLTGTAFDNFIIEEFVATARIQGDENAVRFENSLIMACNQGIAVIGSGGFNRISEQISNLVVPSLILSNINQASFSCAYDTERVFIIGLPDDDSNTAPVKWYVYAADTGQWSTWDRTDVFAIIQDEKLFSLKATQAYEERKSLTRLDYADEQYSVTISAVSGATVTLASATNIVEGMTLKQGDIEGLILEVSGNDLTMDASYDYTLAAAIAYAPIRCEVEFIEQDAGDPTKMKHFLETCGVFENAAFAEIEFSWGSNLSSTNVATTIYGRSSAPWGRFAWGRVIWGGRNGGKQAFRTYIPRNVARCLWIFPRIILNQAFNAFSFSGFSINYNPMSERFRSR